MMIFSKIGGREFTASLENNDTAAAFADMLPLSLSMNELNGNEKYHYLDKSLPAAAKRTETIHAGDIMLYGNSCVVIFYKRFHTTYSYTKIGHIDDIAGLEEAVGKSGVTVEFNKN